MTDPLEPLRRRFRERAVEDAARLEALLASGPDTPDLRRLVHSIAGAAGTFGYATLSEAALVIDDDYARGDTPEAEAFERLAGALQAVAAEI